METGKHDNNYVHNGPKPKEEHFVGNGVIHSAEVRRHYKCNSISYQLQLSLF